MPVQEGRRFESEGRAGSRGQGSPHLAGGRLCAGEEVANALERPVHIRRNGCQVAANPVEHVDEPDRVQTLRLVCLIARLAAGVVESPLERSDALLIFQRHPPVLLRGFKMPVL